jgi:hypothetical protein
VSVRFLCTVTPSPGIPKQEAYTTAIASLLRYGGSL